MTSDCGKEILVISSLENDLPDPFIEQLLKQGTTDLPLRVDSGAVRVGKSRVTFDLVVEQFENGMTPEEMVRAYDTLALADVYAAIAYYLSHRDQAQTYLTRRKAEADRLRAEIEAKYPRITREALMARSAPSEIEHAPAGQ
jgi:uncharacterized protein (DUF433 family)